MSDEAVLRYAQSIKAQEERGRANLYVVGGSPDEAGRANMLARATNLPADVVERNMDEVQRRAESDKMRKWTEQYPAIGQWAAEPRHAAVGRDDLDNLASLARSFGRHLSPATFSGIGEQNDSVRSLVGAALADFNRETGRQTLRNLPGQMARSVPAAVVDIMTGVVGVERAVAENFATYSPLARLQSRVLGKSIEDATAASLAGQQRYGIDLAARIAGPQSENSVARDVVSGVRSLPVSAGAIALAVAGHPEMGAALVSSVVGGNEYDRARSKGLSPAKSALYAGGQGIIEFATERVPALKYFEDTKIGTSFGRKLLNNLMAEMPQEQAATALQDLNEWMALNPEKPFADYIAARPGAVISTAIATAVGSTVTVGTVEGANKLVRRAASLAERRRAAAQARADGEFLDGLAKGVTESKVAKRDRPALAAFLQKLAGSSPVEHVYIPAERCVADFA